MRTPRSCSSGSGQNVRRPAAICCSSRADHVRAAVRPTVVQPDRIALVGELYNYCRVRRAASATAMARSRRASRTATSICSSRRTTTSSHAERAVKMRRECAAQPRRSSTCAAVTSTRRCSCSRSYASHRHDALSWPDPRRADRRAGIGARRRRRQMCAAERCTSAPTIRRSSRTTAATAFAAVGRCTTWELEPLPARCESKTSRASRPSHRVGSAAHCWVRIEGTTDRRGRCCARCPAYGTQEQWRAAPPSSRHQ